MNLTQKSSRSATAATSWRTGKIILSGTAAELSGNDRMRQAEGKALAKFGDI